MPTEEFVTSTREYYPPDFDVNDNTENIYNLQQPTVYNTDAFVDGYTGKVIDKATNRYPYKSNLKHRDTFGNFRSGYNNYSKNTPFKSQTSKTVSKTTRTVRNNPEPIYRKENEYEYEYDLQNGDVRTVKIQDTPLAEDTLIDVIEDLQIKEDSEGFQARPERLKPGYLFDDTPRSIRY